MIVVDGIARRYGTQTALADVSFRVEAGARRPDQPHALAGKSTLLRTLNGFVAPTGGRVEVAGRTIPGLTRRELRELRAEVGMIYQQFHLVRRASALENALAGAVRRTGTLATWLGRFGDVERRRALDALDRVGLLERWAQRADTLSGGQQQRVAIARTMVQGARVVLADEPVASLDPGSSDRVLQLLRSVARTDGVAVVVSLHQVDLALRHCDRIIALDGGRVRIDAPAARVTPGELAGLYQLHEPARNGLPAPETRAGV